KTWPGYILSVAVGLFELYLFGNREKGLLIPVAILGITSLIFFENMTLRWFFDLKLKNLIVAAALIILGLSIIFKSSLPGRSGSANASGGESQNSGQASEPNTGSGNSDGQNS
ncbi:MAG TPA: hypothetical protein VHT34_10485, partial [Clostridia bacterium]|nr:hypothetical protein [Clostridia bacterium]